MALVTARNAELTPDDVLELADGDRYERLDGRLVGVEMSSLSQYVATRLARFLGNHCEPAGLVYVFSGSGYTGFPAQPN